MKIIEIPDNEMYEMIKGIEFAYNELYATIMKIKRSRNSEMKTAQLKHYRKRMEGVQKLLTAIDPDYIFEPLPNKEKTK